MATMLSFVIFNLIFFVIFLWIWNDIEHALPIKKILIYLFSVNLIVVAASLITGFSVDKFMMEWTKVFQNSLQNWYYYSITFLIIFCSIIIPFTYSQLKLLWISHNRKYLWVGGICLLVVVGIWLPFGFNNIGHWETWTIKSYLVFGPPSPLTDEMMTRLSARIPHTVAHLIDVSGFQGHYILHFVALGLKGVLVFAILKKFRMNDILSLSIAVLSMIYPSPTEVMSVRTHSQVIRVCVFLLSVYSFLTYREKPTRLNLSAFLVTMFFTITSVEYPIVLILIFPIFVLYVQKPFTHKFLGLSLIWYIVPIGYICYYMLSSLYIETYVVGREISIFGEIPIIFSVLLRSSYTLLLSNWIDTLSAPLALQRLIIVCIVTIILGYVGYRWIKSNLVVSQKSLRPYILYIGVGLLIILAATAIFSIFPSYRNSDWRMYIYGSLGAAIVVPALFYLLIDKLSPPDYTPYIFFSVFMILFAVAYHHSIQQFEKYWDIATDKRQFTLNNLQQQYEITSSDVEIIYLTELTSTEVENRIDALATQPRLREAVMRLSTSEQVDSFAFCYLTEGNCQFQSKSLRFSVSPYLPDEVIPYDKILFFWIDPDFSITFLDTLPDTLEQVSRARDLYNPLNHLNVKSD